ncbi:hypothetical protein AUR66_08255 [Haloferax profundi]|uniref:Uncharacterized protein n=2 Tax=Haloferax profundi TaxID=1544718 RepID=A0A0W1SVF7_9EURY|nr:hypothetical protein AUR66_08255 [Haloferax profundi]
MNEYQKVMSILLSRERWWTNKEIIDEYNMNSGTVSAALSEFYNKLKITEKDKNGVHRVPSDKLLAGWAYVHYGWDAFKPPEVKDSAADALANRESERARRLVESCESAEEVYELLIREGVQIG